MKPHAHSGFDTGGPVAYINSSRRHSPTASPIATTFFTGKVVFRRSSASTQQKRQAIRSLVCSRSHPENDELSEGRSRGHTRRQALLASSMALGAWLLQSAVASGEDAPPQKVTETVPTDEGKEEVMASRIYDATVIGEPMAIGKDKRKVWEKVMNARIVYLGEAEQVPIRDDKDLELEIVKNLRKRCAEIDRPLSLALAVFPSDLQDQLNQYMEKSIDGETLKGYTSYWPPERWQEYEPLLTYCRDNGVRLVACGTPLKVLRTVQAEGITGLSKADRKLYTPPAGSGFISGFTAVSQRSSVEINYPNQFVPFSPSSYLSAQARVIEEYTMSQNILRSLDDGGAAGLMIVVTGASHVTYGSKGTGVPARISRKIPKKNQVVILLDPERQQIRREGEVPVADFLWYSAARPCNRNCFDRAEIARVMNAAGRKRDALPQDLQKGLDLGLVSPEVLQNFFDLERYPLLSELTHRFQGFRERLLVDPKFLNRLAIEEAISITTTLLAQYERRKENFFQELDYVITDTVRGVVVDFFTVWLPAPTLSFLSSANETSGSDSVDVISDLLGSIPDNAFQKNPVGKNWDANHRLASVLFGGVKLASVGFVSSIGAVASSNVLYAVRRFLNPAAVVDQKVRRSPILKTALVYCCFLGISANLRYQFIAGIVEHRISEEFSSQTFFVNMLSFIARTINSYWGTQQWVDLARYTGLQTCSESPTYQKSESPSHAALECNNIEEANIDEIKNQ